MTEIKKVEKLYKDKISKFLKFNKAYFEKDRPIVSDLEFDNLKKELLDLVKKYPISKTNEQGILNIYFLFIKKLYKVMPQNLDGLTTYSYWKKNDSVMITKQLIDKYK